MTDAPERSISCISSTIQRFPPAAIDDGTRVPWVLLLVPQNLSLIAICDELTASGSSRHLAFVAQLHRLPRGCGVRRKRELPPFRLNHNLRQYWRLPFGCHHQLLR